MTFTEKIHSTIEILKQTDINGCITGSSMLPDANFDEWDNVPDIDVFVYTETQLLYAVDLMMYKYDFEPLSDGEWWKVNRCRNHGFQRNAPLSTVKIAKDDVVINITYKKGKTGMISVLESFDMTTIMVGYDIRHKFGIDMRSRNIKVFGDNGAWPEDPKVAKPNPLRDQDVDMYGVEMWVRQFDRVIKYWKRGIDTRPMAQFYIDLINGVIEKGQLFQTDKSSQAYSEFINTYEPLRDKMIAWLKDKEDC